MFILAFIYYSFFKVYLSVQDLLDVYPWLPISMRYKSKVT